VLFSLKTTKASLILLKIRAGHSPRLAVGRFVKQKFCENFCSGLGDIGSARAVGVVRRLRAAQLLVHFLGI